MLVALLLHYKYLIEIKFIKNNSANLVRIVSVLKTTQFLERKTSLVSKIVFHISDLMIRCEA